MALHLSGKYSIRKISALVGISKSSVARVVAEVQNHSDAVHASESQSFDHPQTAAASALLTGQSKSNIGQTILILVSLLFLGIIFIPIVRFRKR